MRLALVLSALCCFASPLLTRAYEEEEGGDSREQGGNVPDPPVQVQVPVPVQVDVAQEEAMKGQEGEAVGDVVAEGEREAKKEDDGEHEKIEVMKIGGNRNRMSICGEKLS